MFHRFIQVFREREFKRFIRGFLLDSRRLVKWVGALELFMLADYVPDVFWRKLRDRYINLYAVDGAIEYYLSRDKIERDTALAYAEDLLIVNTFFSERYLRRSFRKAQRTRPREEYYLNFGAFFYKLSYMRHGADVYKLMDLYYRPIVKELREIKEDWRRKDHDVEGW